MEIAVVSIFRNSAAYLSQYLRQIGNLRHDLLLNDIQMTTIAGEGDSTDNTRQLLSESGQIDILIQNDHGGPDYGKVDDPRRWAQIAYACNMTLDAVPPSADVVVYVESDLLWTSFEMRMAAGMMGLTQRNPAPVLTGIVRNQHDGSFWDTWGFRRNGENFKHWPPYHPDLPLVQPFHQALDLDRFWELDSCGSLLIMKSDIARTCRFQPEDGIVGWCRDIRAHGYPIWLDMHLSLFHPSDWSAPRE